MAGTKQGAIKLRQTMIKKYGSQEAWSEHMHQIGKKGGANGKGDDYKLGGVKASGFAANPALARRVGKIGGMISRPHKKVVK